MRERAVAERVARRRRRRGRGAARLPARGQRAEAGQRLAGPALRRPALRGFPGQRRRDRRAAGRRRRRARSARRSASRSRPRRAGPARTPISASCCCWRRSRKARAARARRRPSRGDLRDGACARVLDGDDRRRRARRLRGDSPGGARRARPCRGAGRRRRADVTLLEAMRLAADRDGIAREYATAFETTFEIGAPALERARARRACRGTTRSSRRF